MLGVAISGLNSLSEGYQHGYFMHIGWWEGGWGGEGGGYLSSRVRPAMRSGLRNDLCEGATCHWSYLRNPVYNLVKIRTRNRNNARGVCLNHNMII